MSFELKKVNQKNNGLAPLILIFLASCSGCANGPSDEPPAPTRRVAQPLRYDIPAFPGAQGFGAYSIGGRGGQIVFVTNLNDSGEGSLRSALEDLTTPRIIIFKVSGAIQLQSNIHIVSPYVTIAGQTQSVTLVGGGLVIKTHDVIIRFLTIRVGENTNVPARLADGISLDHASDVIIDHVSVSWTLDESMQIWYDDTKNITVQNSIFSEPLNSISLRPDEGHPHGYGPLFAMGSNLSFTGNFIAHAQRRSPRISNMDRVNIEGNVIYNFGEVGIHVRDHNRKAASSSISISDNYIFSGPNTKTRAKPILIEAGRNHEVKLDRNLTDYNCFTSYDRICADLYTMLTRVGSSVPERDAIDKLLVQNFYARKGAIVDCVEKSDDLVCKTTSAIGFEKLLKTKPMNELQLDSDQDGIPDYWELEHALDPTDPLDSNIDSFGLGYSNIETFLNELATH